MQIHSFLMIGQSNMAGRGNPAEVPPIDGRNIVVFRKALWEPYFSPVNADDSFSGVSLAESFAVEYRERHKNINIGLIPCAHGGTTIEMWKKGEPLYENAVFAAKLAMKSSELKGILWHQGESDCANDRYVHYKERLRALVHNLRDDLGLRDLPFIAGGLGDYLPNCKIIKDDFENYKEINRMIKELEHECAQFSFADASGLEANEDMLHFSAAALRTFGERYYECYEKLNNR